jgi:hypothetical protein
MFVQGMYIVENHMHVVIRVHVHTCMHVHVDNEVSDF